MLASQVQSCSIVVDGGCLRNGSQDATGYGSFKVFVNDKEVRHEQFQLPECKTNNQAEYCSWIKALEYIGTEPKRASLPWKILGDSQLVVHQLSRKWKCKDTDLMVYCGFAQDLISNAHLTLFISHISGAEVKKILGH